MNNITDKIKTNVNQDGPGVFNQFITPSTEETEERKSKTDIIKRFLIILLASVIFLSVAAFVYTKLLNKQVEAKKAQLLYYDTTQDIALLEENLPEMRNLSQRLKLVNSIYDNKVYVASMLFPVIESLVESSHSSYVYYNGFNFRKLSGDNMTTVSLSGVAIDYQTLYRQIQNFKNSEYIKNLKMGSMSADREGNVVFDVTFNISISPTDFINYINKSLTAYNTEDDNKSGPLFKAADEPQVSTTTQEVATSTDLDTSTNQDLEISTSSPTGRLEKIKSENLFSLIKR